MALSAALIAQADAKRALHNNAADDAGGWVGWPDDHTFDSVQTAATPDAMAAIIETWRLAGSTTDISIELDWDGDLSMSTTNIVGPSSGQLSVDAGVFGGYTRPVGGIQVIPADGRAPFIDSPIRLYGMPKLEFNGVGFDTYADGGDGEQIRCVQLQRNSTYPIPHTIAYKNCKVGRNWLHPEDAFTEYVQSFDQNGSLCLSVHFENNQFWGCRDPMSAQAKFVRVWNNQAWDYIGDFCTQFSFSAANNWLATDRCNVWLRGNTSYEITDHADLSELHQDFNQTGTQTDFHEGYSVLSYNNIGYGAVGLSGGFQGMYNDDHGTAANEFTLYNNIFCTTSPHGLSLWNTHASCNSYVEQNMVVAPGLRKVGEDWTSGFICNEAEGESTYGTLQINNNILGHLTLNGETATTTGNVFVSPVKNTVSGDGTTENQSIRQEDYLSGAFNRDGTDFLFYTLPEYSSGDFAKVFYGLIDSLEPLSGWGVSAGPSNPEAWENSPVRPAATAPAMAVDLVVEIPENSTPVGTYAIIGGSALIVYTLTGADAALFSINSNTGQVAFLSSPNYEVSGDVGANNNYEITVTATNSAGADSQNITVTVTDVFESNAVSVWLPNGSSYITAPTLGNLLTKTIKIVASRVLWANSSSNTLFSQAGSANREFEFYRNGSSTYIIAGGTTQNIGNFNTLFGSTTLDADSVIVELNFNTGAYSVTVDDVELVSGTLTVGANRVEGTLFRIGARSTNQTAGSTTGASILASGEKVGSVDVYLDDVLERNYVFPVSGATIPDNANSQHGTLQALTGDGSDWEVSNSLPVATAQSVTANVNVAKVITLSGQDADGTIVSATLVADATNGAVVIVGLVATYTPDTDYTGADSFTFTLTDNDGGVSASAATVTITVSASTVNQVGFAVTAVDLGTFITSTPI